MALSLIEQRYLSMMTEREFPTLAPAESAEVMGGEQERMPDDAPIQLAMANEDQPGFGETSPRQFLRGVGETAAVGAKGVVQGFFGLPGDIESLLRGLAVQLDAPAVRRIQTSPNPYLRTFYELVQSGIDFDKLVQGIEMDTVLPTSEDVGKAIDRTGIMPELKQLDPSVVGGLELTGEILAPAGYGKAISKTAEGIKKTAKFVAPKANELLSDYMQRSGLQAPLMAFHGTPHRFDKFDSSKIGSGEGQQAFGHGLYFAENKGVSRGYQLDISKDGFLVGDKVFDPTTIQHRNIRAMVYKGQLDEAIAKAEQVIKEGGPATPQATDDLKKLVEIKAQGGLKPNEGRLLTVDIADNMVSKMLDFDAPLGQQSPEIQALAQRFNLSMDDLGGDLVAAARGKTPAGAEAMRQAGIPGIRYLDQGSRDAGEGTRNLVVFPGGEDQIKILKTEGAK